VLQLLWRLLWALPYAAANLLGALARLLASREGQGPAAGRGWGAELYLDLVVLAVKTDRRGIPAPKLGE